MPGSRPLLAGACFALLAFAGAQAQQDAAAVMAAARGALGGARIGSVTTIVATGRTRQVRGDNLVPIEFEIDIQLPDKYVRTDEIPAQESGPTRRGFTGNTLIQFPAGPPPRAGGRPPGGPPPSGPAPPPRGGGPPPPPQDPVAALKQDFARLTLGMFATSFDAFPLTFVYAGAAEAPEGKADVIDVKGAANFAARLFIDSKTHLPLMISWPGPPNPQQAGPVENRIYFADYRDVDGFTFPFRLRRAVGADTTEETTFDRFRVNAKIDPKKFSVGK